MENFYHAICDAPLCVSGLPYVIHCQQAYMKHSPCYVLADIRIPADGLLSTLYSVQQLLSSLGLPLHT